MLETPNIPARFHPQMQFPITPGRTYPETPGETPELLGIAFGGESEYSNPKGLSDLGRSKGLRQQAHE